jgi:hypothetical protein
MFSLDLIFIYVLMHSNNSNVVCWCRGLHGLLEHHMEVMNT